MKLADWLHRERLTATEFGRRTGLAVSTITRVMKGERRPDWPTIDKIIKETDGEVAPNDFADLPEVDAA